MPGPNPLNALRAWFQVSPAVPAEREAAFAPPDDFGLTYPDVIVQEPIRHESLSLFPLFQKEGATAHYLLSDEAIQAGTVTVEEVSESGSVGELFVTNAGDARVLFIEGEELVGAKQNRVLNSSLLIGAKTRLKIPVSCVEQGRWRYNSKHFGSSGHHSSSQLRRALKESVTRSAQAGRGHRSDQSQVWEEVAASQKSLAACSPTAAMSDTFAMYDHQIADVLDHVECPPGACGVAVGIGDRLVAIDLFDKPETLQKVWRRLLSGVVLETFQSQQTSAGVTVSQVGDLLHTLRAAKWESVPPVGEGKDYRTDANGSAASALATEGVLVHSSVAVRNEPASA